MRRECCLGADWLSATPAHLAEGGTHHYTLEAASCWTLEVHMQVLVASWADAAISPLHSRDPPRPAC